MQSVEAGPDRSRLPDAVRLQMSTPGGMGEAGLMSAERWCGLGGTLCCGIGTVRRGRGVTVEPGVGAAAFRCAEPGHWRSLCLDPGVDNGVGAQVRPCGPVQLI